MMARVYKWRASMTLPWLSRGEKYLIQWFRSAVANVEMPIWERGTSLRYAPVYVDKIMNDIHPYMLRVANEGLFLMNIVFL